MGSLKKESFVGLWTRLWSIANTHISISTQIKSLQLLYIFN